MTDRLLAAKEAREILDVLDVDDDARARVFELVDVHADRLPHEPRSVAAGLTYLGLTFMPGEKRDQSEVANAAGVSEGTVSAVCSSLYESDEWNAGPDDEEEPSVIARVLSRFGGSEP